ncbi:MAG: hypothetical protein QNJ73_08735 [Gammaproteobacteria bacterium]|nr:hypothetical protein [Gammaproteobacteria bacterium]
MDLHDLFLILHLLLFCYWLGGDLGVFYSSGKVIDPTLSDSARVTAAKIMVNLDLVPRICMSLMLTVGGVLSEFKGVPHPTWQMVGIVLLGPVWLAMVLAVHLQEGSDLGKKIAKVDYWFRVVLVIYLLISVTVSFQFGELSQAPWVGAKLIVFAGLVFCGIMIRRYIGPYAQGIHALATTGSTDEINAGMTRSLGQCRPYVLAIWAGLLIETYLGVVEPGGEQINATMSAVGRLAAPLLGY